jgi:hypothetical protein
MTTLPPIPRFDLLFAPIVTFPSRVVVPVISVSPLILVSPLRSVMPVIFTKD